MTTPTTRDLAQDVTTLYERGYITDLSPLPESGEATEEQLRAVLRRAGYTNEQIDRRDYRR